MINRISLNRSVNHCQNLSGLPLVGMHMMRNNGIVINAISLFQQIGIFTITDFHDTFHHHNKLLSLMRLQH